MFKQITEACGNAAKRVFLGRVAAISIAAWCALMLLSPPVRADDAKSPVPGVHTYKVSQFMVVYAKDQVGLPASQELLLTTVRLAKSGNTYVAWHEGLAPLDIRLIDLNERVPHLYQDTALREVLGAVVNTLNQKYHLIGIYASFNSNEIDKQTFADKRSPENTVLTITVSVGMVTELRTIGLGERLPSKDRINSGYHKEIIEHSPIQPPSVAATQPYSTDLLQKDVLDDYVSLLNRHPGRRVDIAVSPGQTEGGIALDYLVNEPNPLTLYAQASNTGTEETGNWRYRAGFIDNQLTGNDDIAALDVSTTDFNETTAVTGSYEIPILGIEKLKMRGYASWDQFTASDVGLPGINFGGREYVAGGEAVANVLQVHDFFLDAVGGARYHQMHVSISGAGVTGDAAFTIPYGGVRMTLNSRAATLTGSAMFEYGYTSADQGNLDHLGRLVANNQFYRVVSDGNLSFYLEPLIDPAGFQAAKTTLANEFVFTGKAVYTLNDRRLVPQEEQVMGGLYTVRGYPESFTAGDSVVIGSAEYRLHIPRLFKVESNPNKTLLFGQPFRFSPQEPLGRADWDFIVGPFVDAGQAWNNQRQALEHNQLMVGAGIGAEVLFKQNVSIRVDWGVALTGAQADDSTQVVNAGSNRFNFEFTVLY